MIYLSGLICIFYVLALAAVWIRTGERGESSPFIRLAAGLYECLEHVHKKSNKYKDITLLKDIACLYPHIAYEEKLKEFKIKRISVFLLIFFIGNVSAVCFYLCSRMETRIADGARIIRNEWGGGNYTVELQAKAGKQEEQVTYQIEEREFSEAELKWRIPYMKEELMEEILNGNESLTQVTGNLKLVNSLPGFPFGITWQSSDYRVLDSGGKISDTDLETKKTVTLTAFISYGSIRQTMQYEVVIIPPEYTDQELFKILLLSGLKQNDLMDKTKKYLTLPDEIHNEAIEWKEYRQDNTLMILLFFLAAAFAAYKASRQELKRRVRLRNDQLLQDYPDFLNKLRLYLGAGLTVKNCFFRMTREYQSGGRQSKNLRYLYEEISLSCHELTNGIPEEKVYENLGKRCGEIHYKKLVFLLTGNLKQGNDKLLAVLSQEAENTLEDRLNLFRRKGEEAGTKLLFPMMLMLLTVMILILLPAYTGFSI